jgi:hypothetical protein
MVSIHRRGSVFQVRRKGFPVASKMFEPRKQAEAWVRKIETEIDRGSHLSREEAESATLRGSS